MRDAEEDMDKWKIVCAHVLREWIWAEYTCPSKQFTDPVISAKAAKTGKILKICT